MQSNSGFAPELVLATGHGADIITAAISPDGRILATGSYDHSVILWDLASYEILFPPLPHPDPATLRFSPDGRLLAALGRWHLEVWNVSTGTAHLPPAEFEGCLIDWENDRQLLVAEPEKERDTLWIGLRDLDTGVFEPWWDTDWNKLYRPPNVRRWIGRSADRSTIAGCIESEMRLWNAKTGELLLTRHVPSTLPWSDREPLASVLRDERTFSGRLEQLALCPQSRRVAVLSYDALWLMDSQTGRRTRVLASGDSPESVAVSPDGHTLASGHFFGGVVLWSLPSGRPVQEVTAHRSTVTAVAYTPDGGRLVSASNQREIKVWDTSNGELLGQMATLAASVNDVAFSPDGSLLASAHGDGNIRLWDPHTGSLLQTQGVSTGGITALAFTSDGRHLLSARQDPRPRHTQGWLDLWTVEALRGLRGLNILRNPHQRTRSLAVSPCGEYFVHAAAPHETQVWRWHDQEIHYELKANVAAISPDGRMLATGCGDRGQAQLRDLATGALLQKLELPPLHDWLLSLRFAPDGKSLYASSDGFAVVRWDLGTGRVAWSRRMERNYLQAFSLAPDRERFAVAGSFSRRIWVRDLHRGIEGCVLRGHRGSISTLAFSPDSATLASGSDEDATIKLWDPATGDLRMTLGVLPGDGRDPSPDWICYTPEGCWHGSSGAERFIRWSQSPVPGASPPS